MTAEVKVKLTADGTSMQRAFDDAITKQNMLRNALDTTNAAAVKSWNQQAQALAAYGKEIGATEKSMLKLEAQILGVAKSQDVLREKSAGAAHSAVEGFARIAASGALAERSINRVVEGVAYLAAGSSSNIWGQVAAGAAIAGVALVEMYTKAHEAALKLIGDNAIIAQSTSFAAVNADYQTTLNKLTSMRAQFNELWRQNDTAKGMENTLFPRLWRQHMIADLAEGIQAAEKELHDKFPHLRQAVQDLTHSEDIINKATKGESAEKAFLRKATEEFKQDVARTKEERKKLYEDGLGDLNYLIDKVLEPKGSAARAAGDNSQFPGLENLTKNIMDGFNGAIPVAKTFLSALTEGLDAARTSFEDSADAAETWGNVVSQSIASGVQAATDALVRGQGSILAGLLEPIVVHLEAKAVEHELLAIGEAIHGQWTLAAKDAKAAAGFLAGAAVVARMAGITSHHAGGGGGGGSGSNAGQSAQLATSRPTDTFKGEVIIVLQTPDGKTLQRMRRDLKRIDDRGQPILVTP